MISAIRNHCRLSFEKQKPPPPLSLCVGGNIILMQSHNVTMGVDSQLWIVYCYVV